MNGKQRNSTQFAKWPMRTLWLPSQQWRASFTIKQWKGAINGKIRLVLGHLKKYDLAGHTWSSFLRRPLSSGVILQTWHLHKICIVFYASMEFKSSAIQIFWWTMYKTYDCRRLDKRHHYYSIVQNIISSIINILVNLMWRPHLHLMNMCGFFFWEMYRIMHFGL